MASACSARLGRTGCTRSSKVPLVSSMSGVELARPVAGHDARGVLGSDSTPRESASRRAGSTVTTQARRPDRARLQGERGGDRGLADAAGSAADHHRAAPRTSCGRSGARPGHRGRVPTPARAATGRSPPPAPPLTGRRARQVRSTSARRGTAARSWGSGSSCARRSHLRPLASSWRWSRNRRAASRAASAARRRASIAGRGGRLRGRRVEPGSGRSSQPFTITGPSCDPGLVLQLVAGLHRLADRHLLGQGHQHHPAAGRIRRAARPRLPPGRGPGRRGPRRAGRRPR